MEINRRNFLKKATVATGGITLSGSFKNLTSSENLKDKPNILWLIAEDFCPDIGCYGNTQVKTPNIDKLTSEGVRFTNVFSTAPVCSSSRSAFMTGMYQTTIGCHQHRTPVRKPLPDNIKVITDYFREAGYFTSNCSNGDWTKRGKTDFNFKVEDPFDGTDWRQREPGQPFFSQINFHETHRKFTRDPENPIDPNKIDIPPYYPDHPVTRRDWANYLESAQVLDNKIGKILKRLEEDGLADNTIVFFFSDQGRPHVRGKQFLYDGGIHIPLIIRGPVPIKPGTVVDDLISTIDFAPTCLNLSGIKVPHYLQGQIFIGNTKKEREFIAAARDRCDETFDRIRCIRTKQYKYIRNFFPEFPYTQTNLYKIREYPVLTLMKVLYAQGKLTQDQAHFMAPFRPHEELYDLSNDPHEIHNLANDPKYNSILEDLRAQLNEWIKQTKDQGENTESPKVAADVFLNRHLPWTIKTMGERGLSTDISPADYLKWWEKQLFLKRKFK